MLGPSSVSSSPCGCSGLAPRCGPQRLVQRPGPSAPASATGTPPAASERSTASIIVTTSSPIAAEDSERRSVADRRAEVRQLERERLRRRRSAARRCRRCGSVSRYSPNVSGSASSRRIEDPDGLVARCRRRRPSSPSRRSPFAGACSGRARTARRARSFRTRSARLMNATSGTPGSTQLRLSAETSAGSSPSQ